jgi:hypothetical protein
MEAGTSVLSPDPGNPAKRAIGAAGKNLEWYDRRQPE